jgi:hypothetical protein
MEAMGSRRDDGVVVVCDVIVVVTVSDCSG